MSAGIGSTGIALVSGETSLIFSLRPYDCLLHFVQWEVPTSNTLINANAIAGFTTAGSSFYRYYGWTITVRFHYYYLLCGY